MRVIENASATALYFVAIMIVRYCQLYYYYYYYYEHTFVVSRMTLATMLATGRDEHYLYYFLN
jgi:hypothetical protein